MNKRQLIEILSDTAYPDNMEVITGTNLDQLRYINSICIEKAKYYKSYKNLPDEFILLKIVQLEDKKEEK